MAVKLIGIDLDGTLLDDNKNISYSNIKAIKKATEENVKIVITTGRPLNAKIKDYHKQLELFNEDQLFIGYNGSGIYSIIDGKCIYKNTLKRPEILEIFNYASTFNTACYAYLDNLLLYNHLNVYVLKEYQFNKASFKKIDLSLLRNDFECFKVMIAEKSDILDIIEANIPEKLKNKYTIVRSMPYYLEFIPKETNKYSSLKYVASLYNIKDDEIMAIGDSMNDYSFIEAYYSVAMGNGVNKIKEDFKYQTLSNNDDGVAYIINKLVLNKTEG